MAILDEVKTVLRITHTKLDGDISAKIAAAREEMKRVGIDAGKAESATDSLILEAVKTYCQYKYASDEKARENLYNSWITQTDGLRKTAGYRAEEADGAE